MPASAAQLTQKLQEIADESAKAASQELGGDVAYKLLGVCNKASLPETGEHQPGATVLLPGGGSRMAHLLCVHIDGDTWLCPAEVSKTAS